MNDGRAPAGTPPHPRGRSLATSLFGGAVLATIATASLAQTYVATVGTLAMMTVVAGEPVVLGGYNNPGDGGGGMLLPVQPTSVSGTCPTDGGIVFTAANQCFTRADPNYSVREWGALCDVVEVTPPGGSSNATWNPGTSGSTMGTLTLPTSLLSTPPTANQFIAISQIGGPTLWVNSTSSITAAATPAVSLTRFSTLGGTQVNYSPGDLISFIGTTGNTGEFSQQAAIIVDAVSSTGSITQWHVLWGGLYAAASPSPPTGTMIQDDGHSHCQAGCSSTITLQAHGAVLTPAWSGWSVLNSQSISNGGTGYAVGDIVTLFQPTNTIVNQGHAPKLIVEQISTGGTVTAYDWLDYGSFNTLPTPYTSLSAYSTSGMGMNLTFSPVAWTQGPFSSTIVSAGTIGSGMSTIAVAGTAAFPGTIDVQSFYYGDDDSGAINSALAAKPASSLVIPAGCGTTRQLDLSRDSSANDANPALVGGALQSSGIYAFAFPPTMRGLESGAPVLSRLLYGGLPNSAYNGFQATSGSGFRNILVEGFGIPEGYGYYGLVENSGTPTGYVGPTFGVSSGLYNIPTAGTAVEIDQASLMRIDNVHIADGGIGPGNSAFQCGLDESDPGGTISGASATITFTNSRLDGNPAFFAGPSNPDFALRLGASCQGSIYRNLSAYDGSKADVLQYDANALSQIQVDSGATFASAAFGPFPTINWGSVANFDLAGVADYGVYVIGATSLSQTVCGIANKSCVFTLPPVGVGVQTGHITDTQMRCGAFTSVPTGYTGVELGAGVVDTSVSGTASAGRRHVPPLQLIVLDDPTNTASASLSLCNNSNALVAGCTGYQGPFASGQFYTQPAVSYANPMVTANTLYAVPFLSPASGGPITKLGIDVVTGPATCRVGVYGASNGQPNALIADGGTLSGTGAGTLTTSGTFSAPVQLAPQTLYFLAVGCNDTPTLKGAANGGSAFSEPLIGAPNYNANATRITASWTFASGGLPTLFGSGTITASSIPNVYAGPRDPMRRSRQQSVSANRRISTMKTVSGLLLTTALAVTVATGASAYSLNPPDASVHLHGQMTFTPNEGGHPFTCPVTMELKTKRQEIKAVKFPKNNCGVALDDFPWSVEILNANSGEIFSNGYSGNGTCVQSATAFQVNGSGIWTLLPGECFSGTFKSDPPTTIVP